MKKYGMKRKTNNENTNNTENEVKEINKIISETNTILNKIIPQMNSKVQNIENKKEKYKFRKKEKKENKTIKENKEKEIQKEKEKDIKLNEENKENKNLKENTNEIKEKKETKKEKKNKLKDDINEIERVCTSKTLKKDLVELYEKILENNSEFRDKIFFKNLLDTEKKIGLMDSYEEKPISHTFKEIETKDILRNIENEESLIKKYTLRANKIKDEN